MVGKAKIIKIRTGKVVNTFFVICFVFFVIISYEVYGNIYTIIAKDKTLARAPFDSIDAPSYQACVSRCHYDRECLSFDFTPGSPLGVCSFYDVLFIMGNQTHQLINKPGTIFYSSLPKPSQPPATTKPTTTTQTTTTKTTTTQTTTTQTTMTTTPPPPRLDCAEWYNQGYRENRVYPIKVIGIHDLEVYCNMEEDGGGWIVFQRRFDGSVNFDRYWNEYRDGFGDKSGEHCIG